MPTPGKGYIALESLGKYIAGEKEHRARAAEKDLLRRHQQIQEIKAMMDLGLEPEGGVTPEALFGGKPPQARTKGFGGFEDTLYGGPEVSRYEQEPTVGQALRWKMKVPYAERPERTKEDIYKLWAGRGLLRPYVDPFAELSTEDAVKELEKLKIRNIVSGEEMPRKPNISEEGLPPMVIDFPEAVERAKITAEEKQKDRELKERISKIQIEQKELDRLSREKMKAGNWELARDLKQQSLKSAMEIAQAHIDERKGTREDKFLISAYHDSVSPITGELILSEFNKRVKGYNLPSEYLLPEEASNIPTKTKQPMPVTTNQKYSVGQVVSTPKGDFKVTGFDTDGEPLVEPVR